jgi:general stress protein YciG
MILQPVKKYLSEIGKKGGKAAGGDKAAAARENGKRGGRPKKIKNA